MNTCILTVLTLAGGLISSQAAIFDITYPVLSGSIPDGDLNGRVDVRTISGVAGTIRDVVVFLDIEGTGLDGGWMGDLYVTLRHETAMSVLLNRPGRTAKDAYGSSRNGLRITLEDGAPQGDVHLAPDGDAALTGTWAPDGRELPPTASPAALDSAGRTALLGVFEGLPVAGDWTLLVMDTSSGGEVQLKEWGLSITYDPIRTAPVVPEASAWWVSGVMLLAAGACRLRKGR